MKARTDRRLQDDASEARQTPCLASLDAGDASELGPTGPVMGTNLEICSAKLGRGNGLGEVMSSSCGDREGRVSDMTCPSPLGSSGGAELLHELSNLMTGVLVNAQVLEWKLPPYSHLKRPVRELARNAQRSSELLKRLMRRYSDAGFEELALHLTGDCDGCTSGIFPKRDDSS